MTTIGSTTSSTSTTSSSSTTSTNTTTNTNTGGPDAIGYGNSQSGSHVYGLVSGVDVDSIVAKMMAGASQPLIQMEQLRQILEWQQDDYRSMNSALLDLQTQTFNMSLQSSYLSKVANSSNSSLVTATAGTNAPKTNYTISAGSTATAAYVTSSGSIQASGTTIDPTESLWVNRNNFATKPFTYTTNQVSSEAVTLDSTGTTGSLQNKFIINNDPNDPVNDVSQAPITITANDSSGNPITYDYNSNNIFFDQASYNSSTATNKVLIDPTTGSLTFNTSVSSVSASYSYGTVTPSSMTADIQTPDSNGNLKDTSLTFTPDQSINDIMSAINTSGAGVTAIYGDGNQSVSLTSNQTGNLYKGGPDIQFTGSLLTSVFNLQQSSEQDGQDASLTINGTQVSSHTNTVTVNNVTFNINGNFSSTSATNPTTVNVNVTNDTTQILNNIESWVDKYNSTIATINSKLSEKRDRSYMPLTSTQQSQMSATQIQQWTDKAKSGLLSTDTILPGGLSQMRQDIYSPVTNSGTYTQLSQIGITSSSNYQDNGKLIIDENTLKQAIANDPQSVMNLFTQTSDSYSGQGIMQRLNTTLKNTMSKVTQVAGNDSSGYSQYSLGLQINDYNTRISDEQTRLDALQTRYYKQFTAMETAISTLNQQSSMFQSSVGG